MLLCSVATLRRLTGSRPCTEVTIGTPRLCIVVVNTRGVRSDGVKDKVFHALVNPRIPLSDRQETLNCFQAQLYSNALIYLSNTNQVKFQSD